MTPTTSSQSQFVTKGDLRETTDELIDYIDLSNKALKDELIDEMGEMRKELKGEMGEMRKEMSTIKDEVGGIKNEIGSIKEEIGGIKGDMRAMREDMADIRDEIKVSTKAIMSVLNNHESRIRRTEERSVKPV